MSLITAPPALPTLSPGPPPATGLMTFFLPDSAPSSLVASIVQVNSVDGEIVTSLVLDCPEGTKPVKDACRAAGVYPASVYHTRGSIWGGTTTVAADDSTTAWRCALAARYTPSVDGTSVPGMSAYCTRTIDAPGKARETVTTKYDHCYIVHHQLPIVVTAGGEKLADGGFYSGTDADGINRALASEAGSISGCTAVATSLVFWKVPVGPGMVGSATSASASTRTGGGGGGGGAQPTPTDGGLGGGSGGGAGGGAGGGVGGGSGPGPGVTPTGSVVPSAGGRMLPSTLGLVKGAMAALALLTVLGL